MTKSHRVGAEDLYEFILSSFRDTALAKSDSSAVSAPHKPTCCPSTMIGRRYTNKMQAVNLRHFIGVLAWLDGVLLV